MTHIEQAIKDAKKAGWIQKLPQFILNTTVITNPDLLDLSFWQALGKAWGWREQPVVWQHHSCGTLYWKDEYGYNTFTAPEWFGRWHQFIDHLAERKDAESFFATLV